MSPNNIKGDKNFLSSQPILKFPDNFLWGAATSAYQIEGNNHNDWSEWEKSKKRLNILMKKGKYSEDFICGQACDSYNRYSEDLNLAVNLNNNAVRLGIEWSRIEPEKEKYNVEALNHYKTVLKEAKKRGLVVMITLWHYTNPIWLVKEGGWGNKKAVDYFAKYVNLIVKELRGNIDLWTTLNEPMVYVAFGYIKGFYPPAKKLRFYAAHKVINNLIRAHKAAYEIIHKHLPYAKVSFNTMNDYFEPLIKWCPLHILYAKTVKYFHHQKFLNKTKNYLDFIALNYYHHNRISFIPPFKFNKNKTTSDMGWEIYPEGIYYVLKSLKKFKNIPIYITENGLADEDDDLRPKFIVDHLKYVHQAIAEGVDVRGYFHWSLLDNFEWAHGWGPKFGLYKVDRTTFERTPRSSAAIYAEICRNNSIIIV